MSTFDVVAIGCVAVLLVDFLYHEYGIRCSKCKRWRCIRTHVARGFGGTVHCYRCRACGAVFLDPA